MRAVLSIFVLVATAVACPTTPDVDQCVSVTNGHSSYSSTTVEKSLTATSVCTSDLPAFCPTNWQVVSIDTICVRIIFIFMYILYKGYSSYNFYTGFINKCL